MIIRISKLAAEIGLTIAAVIAIGIALLAWRLSAGPISLGALTPILERALSAKDGSVVVDLDDTVIVWTGWERNLDIHLHGVHLTGQDGALLAVVPEVSVTLSARALLRGILAPVELVVFRPRLTIVRTKDGGFEFGGKSIEGADSTKDDATKDDAARVLPLLLQELAAPHDPTRSAGYLEQVSIVDAVTTVYDLANGRTWRVPDTDATLTRGPDGLSAALSMLVEIDGEETRLRASATYANDSGTADVQLSFTEIGLEQLAKIGPRLKPLTVIRTAVSGTIGMKIQGARLASINFDITGGSGNIRLEHYFPDDIGFRLIRLRGGFPEGIDRLDLAEASIDLGGTTIGIAGEIAGLSAAPRISLQADLRNVPTNDLGRLWPQGVGASARRWITQNLSDGAVEEGRFEIVARAKESNPRDVIVEKITGSFRYAGLTIEYLRPMPPVRNVRGTAILTGDRLDLAISSGGTGALAVDGANIAVTGLSGDDERAAIEVVIRGPLRDTLDLIDSPPLGFVKGIGLKPVDFGGDATVRLGLKFPLVNRLKFDDIAIVANAEVTGFSQRNAALEQDASEGTLALRVDNRGMEIKGNVVLGPVRVAVEMTRTFLATPPVVSRTIARARMGTSDRAAFGLDTEKYATGPLDLVVTYNEMRNRTGEFALDVDLNDTRLSLAEFEWIKESNVPATWRLELKLADGRLVEMPVFRLASGDQIVSARGVFAKDGKTLSQIDVDALKIGRTSARGSLTQGADGFALKVEGAAFDIGYWLKTRGPVARDRPALRLDARVERLYIGRDRYFDHVRFDGYRSAKRWEQIDLTGLTPVTDRPGQAAYIALKTVDGRQTLEAGAEDAGALFKALDVTPNIIGGRVTIKGATDPAREANPISGRIAIRDFRLVNAPFLARVLSVALLTGILDSLQGEGIGFSGLDSTFRLYDDKVELDDMSAYGSAVGVTGRGAVDTVADTIDLEGTVVPAYAVNSILGNIPLLGQILVPERGGGVFAANYKASGPLADPKVSVSPLSTLAPGFLRRLFRVIEDGTSPTGSEPRPVGAPDLN